MNTRLGAVLGLALALAAGAHTDGGTVAGATVLEPCGGNVRLERGRLATQLERTREYYLAIENDDLLRGFRLRAGRPAPGEDLGGWYGGDVFHIFGQVLSGLARLYRATGDEACREKLAALIEGWAECVAPDGFFYFSGKPNAYHYVYDKMVGGLVDAYLYCDYEPALRFLSRITDWAEATLARGRSYADGSSDTEWYTLSENLTRAYLATGDARYRAFAEVWEYPEYWDQYQPGRTIFDERASGGRTLAYHAYSHVNTLGGLGAGYLATGEASYLARLEHAYDWLRAEECYATGGYGPDEQLLPHEQVARRLRETHRSFETQCGAWAAFKMSRYLITCTGEARFGDWVERLVWNGLAAEVPMDPAGNTFYYSDYNLGGGRKTYTSGQWPCCAGTHPIAVADYADLVYYTGPRGIYVSQFVPSTLRTRVTGTEVTIEQRTRFPERDTVELALHMARPTRLELGFRLPEWLAGEPEVRVNGEAAASARRDGWAVVEREWREGDVMSLRLPMRLGSEPVSPPAAYPAAVLYGPVVLAFDTGDPRPLRALDATRLDEELAPDAAEPLTFRLARDPSVAARPFYAFRQSEPYFLYVSPDMAQAIHYGEFRYEGPWPIDSGAFRATNAIGARTECSFEGTGVAWLGERFDDAAIAEVRIDGEVVALVDQYAPGRGLPFRWESPELPAGRHTIRITVTDGAHPDSRDHFTNIGGLEVR